MDMPFLKLLSFFLLVINSFNFASSYIDIPTYFNHSCTIHTNFSSDSPYQFNLNTLLISLYSNASAATDTNGKFYNNTVGNPNINNTDDAVYGEYMCRGDVPIEVCKNCVQDATSRIASECPYNREAIIWYDECFVRYSDRSFFSSLDQLPTVSSNLTQGPQLCGDYNRNCAKMTLTVGTGDTRSNHSRSDANSYGELNKTLSDAVVEAATSGPAATNNFAIKEADLASWGTVYTLVQCTPDLSPQFCSKCLHGLIKYIPKQNTASGGRILNPSCSLRFAPYRFYYKANKPPSYIGEGTVTIFSPSLVCTT